MNTIFDVVTSSNIMISVLFRMCGESEDEFVKEEEVKREDVNEDEIKIEIKEKEGKRKIRVAVAGCVHGEIDKVQRSNTTVKKNLCMPHFEPTLNKN